MADNDLIAFTGVIGAGKSFAGQVLEARDNYLPLAWADPLKRAVEAIWGLPMVLLQGDVAPSREWREQPHDDLVEEFGAGTTPRWLLQHFGSECCRGWREGIWVNATARAIHRARLQGRDVVLTDTRFPNEARRVRDLGGIVVRIDRPGARAAGCTAHVSEAGIPDDLVDQVIVNDGTRGFERRVRRLVKRVR